MKHILLIFMLLLVSCSSSAKKQLLISTKVSAVSGYKVLEKVETAKKCNLWFFYVPLPANFEEMKRKALEEAESMGGDAIIDFQIRNVSHNIIFPIWSIDCYVATGTVVKFSSEGSSWDASPLETKEQETKSTWDSPQE
jgi:hypothetical protein